MPTTTKEQLYRRALAELAMVAELQRQLALVAMAERGLL